MRLSTDWYWSSSQSKIDEDCDDYAYRVDFSCGKVCNVYDDFKTEEYCSVAFLHF